MKVFLVTLVCALGSAAASVAQTHSAIAWPGAIPVASPLQKTVLTPHAVQKTIVPANTKTFAYSTTQYLNALPVSYQLRPQVAYQFAPFPQQFAQVPQFAQIQPGYYPIGGSSYYPGSIYYPSITPIAPVGSYPIQPISPVTPEQPSGSQPTTPEQPSGDADTSVVDSAEFPQQDQSTAPQFQPTSPFPSQNPEGSETSQSQLPTPAPENDTPSYPQTPQENPSFPQGPQGNPSFPQGNPSFPQIPQGNPSFPQAPQGNPSFPQFPGGSPLPSFPQFPQEGFPSFPQFPQGSGSPSFPQFPQLPQYPSLPQGPNPAPPATFPSADNNDKGLNDEDTISVESA